MADTISFEVKGYECLRCGHQWQPRGNAPPLVCPKCKSPYWDTAPKKRRQAVTPPPPTEGREQRTKASKEDTERWG